MTTRQILGAAFALALATPAVAADQVRARDQVRDQIALDLFWIHEMRHAEAFGEQLAPRIDVHTHDAVGARHARALDHVEADAAQAKHHDIRAGLDLRGIDHGTDAGRDAATDVADLLEWRILADLRQRDLRQYRVIREGRAAHVMMNFLAADREAAAAIRHHALALGGTDRRAEIGLARQAGFAFAAFRRVERDHVIALPERPYAGAHLHDDSRALVAEDHREQSLRIRAGTREFVRVTDAGRTDLDQHFTRLRAIEFDLDHFERLAGRPGNCCACLHVLRLPPLTHVQAAVQREVRAGREGRVIRREPGDHRRDLLRRAEPADRDHRNDLLEHLRLYRPDHVRADIAG